MHYTMLGSLPRPAPEAEAEAQYYLRPSLKVSLVWDMNKSMYVI